MPPPRAMPRRWPTAPDDAVVAMRAYRQALAVGDYALAGRADAVLVKAGDAPPDAAIARLRDRAQAPATRAGARRGARPAGARGRSTSSRPCSGLAGASIAARIRSRCSTRSAGDALARRYAAEHRVLLLIALRSGPMRRWPRLRSAAAPRCRQRGSADQRGAAARRRPAGAMCAQTLLARHRGPIWSRCATSLGKRRRSRCARSARRGCSSSLAVDLAQDDATSLSVLLTRAALLLDPQRRSRPAVSSPRRCRAGGSPMLALDVLGQVRKRQPFRARRGGGRIAMLRRAGPDREALALAKVRSPGTAMRPAPTRRPMATCSSPTTASTLPRRPMASRSRATAATMTGRSIISRARALDRAGRWDEALPALRRAVELGARSRRTRSTYLGYRADRASARISPRRRRCSNARAALKPDDAGDHRFARLGLFQRGDVARALPLLERAAQGDPGGSAINEHLGDAYWQLGRRYEARYAWRAAAIYADNDAAARIAAKLANGLTRRPIDASKPRAPSSTSRSTSARGAPTAITRSRRCSPSSRRATWCGSTPAEAPASRSPGRLPAALAGEGDNLVTRAAARFAEAFGGGAMGDRAGETPARRLGHRRRLGRRRGDACARWRGCTASHSTIPACSPSPTRWVRMFPPACSGATAIGRGRGEQLEPVAGLPGTPVLLVNPGVAVSTAAVFAAGTASTAAPLPRADRRVAMTAATISKRPPARSPR